MHNRQNTCKNNKYLCMKGREKERDRVRVVMGTQTHICIHTYIRQCNAFMTIKSENYIPYSVDLILVKLSRYIYREREYNIIGKSCKENKNFEH